MSTSDAKGSSEGGLGPCTSHPGIKLVFFDIDGTLLSERTHRVPPRTRRALKALRARGVRIVVATGRHPLELDGAGLDGLTFDGYAAANGQLCLDETREPFAGWPIGPRGVQALVRLFDERELLLWFFEATDSYANRHDERLTALALATLGRTPAVDGYRGNPLYQAVAFVPPHEEPALAAELPGCKLQRWGDEGVDIIAEDGGKVAGMRVFLDHFCCARDECAAFGDQQNDLDMLCFAGIGVAMGNAAPVVRQAADYVTTSVDDDGVARALEQLGILEPGWDR